MDSSRKRLRKIEQQPTPRYIDEARQAERNRLQKRRATFRIRKQPTEDLFRKLPPEIRNSIYKLVLVNEAAPRLASRQVAIRFRRWRATMSHVSSRYLHWQEPALLQVTKWVRSETKLLYYTSHHFAIRFTSSDIDPLCKWIRFLVKDVDASMVLSHFSLICTKLFWMDMPFWLPLAKLTRDLGAKGCLGSLVSRERFSRCNEQRFPERAHGLKQVALLGLHARDEGWKSDTKLKKEFDKWTEKVLAKTKPIGRERDEVQAVIAQVEHISLRLKRTPDGYHCEECRAEAKRRLGGKQRKGMKKNKTASGLRLEDPTAIKAEGFDDGSE